MENVELLTFTDQAHNARSVFFEQSKIDIM